MILAITAILIMIKPELTHEQEPFDSDYVDELEEQELKPGKRVKKEPKQEGDGSPNKKRSRAGQT